MIALRSLSLQAICLLALSFLAGAVRQWAPDGLFWRGQWPTNSTSAEDAYKMMAKPGDPPFVSLAEAIDLQHDRSVIFLDARAKAEFAQGRIPHARNLPYYELEANQHQALQGLNETSPIVIYCEGIGCELSFFLARELGQAGYKNLKVFYGGYPEWKGAGLPVEK